jgi:hypothetical protein
MNILKILTFFLLAIGIAACATHQSNLDRSEYQRGYSSARDFAKKDSINSDCARYPHFAYQEGKKKYAQMLKDQGESESYMKGFYSGYEDRRIDFFELYCEDDAPWGLWPL